MPRYEEVLTRDGIAILKDGEQMLAREIAAELNAAAELKWRNPAVEELDVGVKAIVVINGEIAFYERLPFTGCAPISAWMPIPEFDGFEDECVRTKTIPVGETFMLNCANYRVVATADDTGCCDHCAFDARVECNNAPLCSSDDRLDSTSVYFVLEGGND